MTIIFKQLLLIRMIEQKKEKENLSFSDICKATGLNKSTLIRTLNRKTWPSLATLMIFCEWLDKDVCYFFTISNK